MLPAHEKKFLHALLATGAEYDSLQKLSVAFDSYRTAWGTDSSLLQNAGLNEERAQAIVAARETFDPDDAMRQLIANGIALISKDDAEYPQELKEIASPPEALYIKGRIEPNTPRLAVVGTRKATPYGREATRKIIRDLAEATDIVIVSGLAQGIDTEAHRSALAAGISTIGILGSGIDRNSFFPPENWTLAEEMVAKKGAVVSEYPPGAPALKHHFPARNRIIAALSLGTLVIEAPERSGALITARFALEGGRDVFAVPGQMFSPNAAGTHRLIQDGAKLVTRADDIIEELGLTRRARSDIAAERLTDEFSVRILELLQEPKDVDELRAVTDRPTPDIITCLSILELKGFVRPMGQNRFQRIA